MVLLISNKDMELSKQAIEEFREIYYKEYGEWLSYEEAERVATGLIELMSVVYGPREYGTDEDE